MRGAISPLIQYDFMAWCSVKSTGATLPLPLISAILKNVYNKSSVSQLALYLFVTHQSLSLLDGSLFKKN
jgi:hypothetical protein